MLMRVCECGVGWQIIKRNEALPFSPIAQQIPAVAGLTAARAQYMSPQTQKGKEVDREFED